MIHTNRRRENKKIGDADDKWYPKASARMQANRDKKRQEQRKRDGSAGFLPPPLPSFPSPSESADARRHRRPNPVLAISNSHSQSRLKLNPSPPPPPPGLSILNTSNKKSPPCTELKDVCVCMHDQRGDYNVPPPLPPKKKPSKRSNPVPSLQSCVPSPKPIPKPRSWSPPAASATSVALFAPCTGNESRKSRSENPTSGYVLLMFCANAL